MQSLLRVTQGEAILCYFLSLSVLFLLLSPTRSLRLCAFLMSTEQPLALRWILAIFSMMRMETCKFSRRKIISGPRQRARL